MKKKIVILGLSVASVFLFSTAAFAAGWKQDDVGWWYQNEDGTYPQREWKWVDGNGDGVSECYYFDSDGYCMMNNVTPDGYVVNTSGAWIDKGVVQTQVGSQTQVSEYTDSNSGNTEQAQAENQTAVQTGKYSLTLTDHQTIGGKYDVGTTVPLTGIITSGGIIKDVTVELRTTYLGTRSKKKTYSVMSNQVNLADLDLGELDTRYLMQSGAGYAYIVKATNALGEEKQLIKEYFNMKYLRGENYSLDDFSPIEPSVIEGTDYRVHGVINANYPISSIYVTLKSMSGGETFVEKHIEPYTYSYDISSVADAFDFSELKEGKYKYHISATIGEHIVIFYDKCFEVKKDNSKSVEVYTVNASFDIRDDGSMVITNGTRPFQGRILNSAKSRVKQNYGKSHPYVVFSWKKDKSDKRINHVYAHSFGRVASVGNGSVTIEHENGYQTKYTGLKSDEIYAKQGVYVDENTTLGVIPENKTVSVYLYDESGEALNIKDYLDSDF